jgi:hypothetical protein
MGLSLRDALRYSMNTFLPNYTAWKIRAKAGPSSKNASRCGNIADESPRHGPPAINQLPVPERVTVCGLLGASSAIVTLPVRAPVTVGVNVTLITQVAAGATMPPLTQVVPAANAKSPLIVTDERLRVAPPVLVSVTMLAALVLFTFCLPNRRFPGLSETFGCTTVCVTLADVLTLKLLSPEYCAFSPVDPTLVRLRGQLPRPALRVAPQDSPVPAVTVTLPVGTPGPATLKFTITACPTSDGSGVSEIIVVMVAARLTCNVTVPAATA